MRFIIYGAGGVGGTIGARLHMAGESVVLIARGAHLEALRSDGLRFVTATLDERLHIPAVGHPQEIDFGPDDVVILCMKSQHTRDALNDLYAAAGDNVPVVCCQNGVANERMALRKFRRVYGMVVWLPAEHLDPGVVFNTAEAPAGLLDTGCFPTGVDALIEEVAASLTASGLTSRADTAAMRHKYAKLLDNLNNAVQAACGTGSREVAKMLRDEALACYAAAGIDCPNADEVRETRAGAINTAPIPGRERTGGSSWQSVMRGTGDIETDYLNGEIVQLGRLHGVATPANAVVQRLGNQMVRERRQPGDFTVDDLLSMIEIEAAG